MYKYFAVNSFAYSENGGNPAGVVVDSFGLAETDFVKIAAKIGFSETAFVFQSYVADFKVRFFTPMEEVNLCGHATIATFFVLHKIGKITIGKYKMETKAGILEIEVTDDGKILMQQPLPAFYGDVKRAEVAESLNISKDKLIENLPIQIFSTGLKDIIVPIRSRHILDKIEPDFDQVTKISKNHKTVGYHLFTFDNGKIYCRNFAPLLGINEESATGTASGALASYLVHNKQFPAVPKIQTSFYQGFSMGQKSKIDVILQLQNQQISKLQVGGICKNMQEEILPAD